MTRPLLLTAVLLCAGAGLQSPSHADATADARNAIQAVYDRQDAAARHNDVQGMMDALTNDFNATGMNGITITRLESRRMMMAVFPALRKISSHTAIQWIDTRNKEATVITRSRTVTVADGSVAEELPVQADTVARALWVKTNAGWKIRRQHILSSIATVNGKPVLSLRGSLLARDTQ